MQLATSRGRVSTWTTQRHRRTTTFRRWRLRRLSSRPVQRQLHCTASLLPRWTAVMLLRNHATRESRPAAGWYLPLCLLFLTRATVMSPNRQRTCVPSSSCGAVAIALLLLAHPATCCTPLAQRCSSPAANDVGSNGMLELTAGQRSLAASSCCLMCSDGSSRSAGMAANRACVLPGTTCCGGECKCRAPSAQAVGLSKCTMDAQLRRRAATARKVLIGCACYASRGTAVACCG